MISEARLEHLTNTNDAPEPYEIPWIQGQVSDSDAAMVHLDAEIARVKATLAQLNIQRNAQSDRSHSLRQILSPIRVIPIDILEQLFAACRAAPSVPHSIPGEHRSLRLEAPLQISQICSSWRTIVLNTPLLWSDLTFTGYVSQSREKLQKLWIERSRTVPLSLAVLAYPPNPSLDALQPYFTRTRALATHIDLSALSSLAKSTIADDSFPQLQSLSIVCGNVRDRNRDSVTVFRSAHHLTHFTLERFRGDLAAFDLPWAQLTTLHLRNIQVSVLKFWRIFSICENLEELIISEFKEEEEDADSRDRSDYMVPILMPSLKKIIYHINRTNHNINPSPSWLMQRLIVPVLEDFTVTRYHMTPAAGKLPWIDFREMQHRSSFALKRLELGHVRLLADPAIALADLPSLIELTSDYALPLTAAFFHALTPALGEATPLLPNLRVLRLARNRAQAVAEIEDVARMVEARVGGRGVAPLRVFRMASLQRDWDDALVTRLGQSIKAGLEVEPATYNW